MPVCYHKLKIYLMIEFYFFIATLLSSDGVSNMHPTSNKSGDRESILLNDQEGLVEVNLEDPWVLREDFKPKRRGRAFGKCEKNYLNSTRCLAKYSFRVADRVAQLRLEMPSLCAPC